MKKRIIAATVAGILAVSMIAGCASKSSREPARADTESAAYDTPYMSGAATNDSLGFNKGYEAADYEYMEESFEGTPAAGSVNPAPDVNIDPSLGRLLIRTVSITAETTKYVEVASNLESQVMQ